MTDSLSSPAATGWIAEMLASGTTDDWCANALVFPDAPSAANYARDLFSRWMGCDDWRVVEVQKEPNKPSTMTDEQRASYTDSDGFPA